MLSFLEDVRDKINDVVESEMALLIKAHAALKKENDLLKSALNKTDTFSAAATYDVKYRGEVSVVFHINPDTKGRWHVTSSSTTGTHSCDALTKLAAVEMVDAAMADPDHELVRDHLS